MDRCARHAVVPSAGRDGAGAPVIYFMDMDGHPFDLAGPAAGLSCNVVSVAVRDWHDSLTPWPAPALYHGEPDFGGQAGQTLDELLSEAIPTAERSAGLSPARRAICGYSLGGLFALYAFARSDAFAACGCLSGSVWYEGWTEYLRRQPMDGTGRLCHLSLGSKERRGPKRVMRSVQANMEECADILRGRGCKAELVVSPGGHMANVGGRIRTGLLALDGFLCPEPPEVSQGPSAR